MDVNNKSEHIFLSYRSIESDFALKLAADLKNAGVRLWMDRLDGIQVGMDWRDTLEDALNSCAALIAILSPDYVASEYCRKELARANSLKRPIFPVILRSLKPQEIPLVLESIQYEDFTNWFNDNYYQQKFNNLLKRLRQEVGEQVGDIPNVETRYLNRLISELESRRGVLEYVELQGETETPDERPKPHIDDEWGFAELLEQAYGSSESSKIIQTGISEIPNKYSRFVMVGEPGAGKTTTIRRLARDAARKRLQGPRMWPLPLLLYLPQWKEEETPLEFIQANYTLDGDLSELLKNGEILLYLDGLNEIGGDRDKKAKLIAEWFSSPRAPKYVIITCRANDYTGELILDIRNDKHELVLATPIVTIHQLNELQIDAFVKSYLREKADEFLQRIFLKNTYSVNKSFPALGSLVQNPYMLGALLYLYQMSSEAEIPTNSGSLFLKFTKALWKRETQRGTIVGKTYEEIQAAMGKLAFAMIDEDMPIDVPLEYAINKLGDETLLYMGINMSCLLLKNGFVRFYHQLIQEFFAAVLFDTSMISTKLISTMVHREMTISRALSARPISKWDQVVIASCGLKTQAETEEYIDILLAVNPYLASDCLASGINITDDLRAKIAVTLVNSSLNTFTLIFDEIFKSIYQLGDVVIPHLIGFLEETDWRKRFLIVQLITRMRDASYVPSLAKLLEQQVMLFKKSLDEHSSRIKRVLIIDSEHGARTLLSIMIQRSFPDIDIHTVNSALEGLEIFTTLQPTLTIVKYNMRKMSGIEFISRVLDNYPNSKVILKTASLPIDGISVALNSGAYKIIGIMLHKDMREIIKDAFDTPSVSSEIDAIITALKVIGTPDARSLVDKFETSKDQ